MCVANINFMYYKKEISQTCTTANTFPAVLLSIKRRRGREKKEMCAFQQRENTKIFVETIRYLAVINGHTIQKPILMHHRSMIKNWCCVKFIDGTTLNQILL